MSMRVRFLVAEPVLSKVEGLLEMTMKIFLCGLTVCSVFAETGRSGASFLKLAPTAGAEAMGGAYTAVTSGIGALYYNPAGMLSEGQTQAGFTHTSWIQGMTYDFAGVIMPLMRGSMGMSVISLRSGGIDGRDGDGNKTGDFESSDTAFTVSAAREFNNKNLTAGRHVMLGASVKFIRQTIADESAEGIAVDLGAMRELTDRISLGLSVRNLGPDMKFIEEKYPLPLTLTVGGMFRFAGLFGLTADMAYEPVDDKKTFRMGMQIAPARFMVLRAGYVMKALSAVYGAGDADSFDDAESAPGREDGIGGGVGFNFGSYALDYSIKPYAELGTSQRLSFKVGF